MGHTGICRNSADRKERSPTGEAFKSQSKTGKSLTVVTEALIEKIVFSSTSQDDGEVTATDVRYTKNGKSHLITAKGEVIPAAGSFASSPLLELSGMGDHHRPRARDSRRLSQFSRE